MDLNFQNIISLLTVFQAFLFAIYLISINPERRISNYLIAGYLIIFGLDSGASYVMYFVYSDFPILGMIISMTLYLGAPLLFLYIKSSIYNDFKLRKVDSLHLLPFVIMNLLLIPYYYLVHFNRELAPQNAEIIFEEIIMPVNYVAIHVQLTSYLIASYVLLHRYNKLYFENFSNSESYKYKYLMQLIIIIFILDIISLVKNVLMFNMRGIIYEYTLGIVNLMALIMVCWIVIKALQSPELYKGINSKLRSVSEILKENKKHKTGEETIVDESSNKVISKIKTHMEEDAPYKDASLSLDELARQVKISSKELSVLINHIMGLHFFDFVNEYRINHAKQILSDKDQSDLTVLEILYEVGFNSKSSFNTEFKKRTGLTPTVYRKTNLLSSS